MEWQGRQMGIPFEVRYGPLAEACLMKALEHDPTDQNLRVTLARFRELRTERGLGK
jgi:hypothetical protein